ncbi:MAG: type II secretion system F family protein [Candidatus Hydrogenedentales bacterium]
MFSDVFEESGQTLLMPTRILVVIGVGEDGGMLDETLLQLAEEYERDVEREIKVFMTLLEPAMIIGVGLVVGFIVMAMLLPIFDLGQAIQP